MSHEITYFTPNFALTSDGGFSAKGLLIEAITENDTNRDWFETRFFFKSNSSELRKTFSLSELYDGEITDLDSLDGAELYFTADCEEESSEDWTGRQDGRIEFTVFVESASADGVEVLIAWERY